MRDPNRLDKFYDELKELHKKYFPDLRFGQLMYNFFSWYGDPFYLEEDKFMETFRKYIAEICEIDEEDV